MKPHVICHMMSPLDGRLLVDEWAPEGSTLQEAMLAEYQRIHDGFAADAWLAGTKTMTEFATGQAAPAASGDSQPERPWHVTDPAAKRYAIAIDRHAKLHWDTPTADNAHVVVVLTASVADSHLAELTAAGVSYVVMPGNDIDLAEVLNAIGEKLGIKTLLLEGGATINGAFLKAGLVDEISLLLCPAIDGKSGSPAIFEAGDEGLGQKLQLKLVSAKPGAHDTVHVQYQVVAR